MNFLKKMYSISILLLLLGSSVYAKHCNIWVPIVSGDLFSIIPFIPKNDLDCDGIIDTIDEDIDEDIHLPIAKADYITTNEDTPVLIDVLDNDIDFDGDTLTITNLSKPKYGFVELRDNKVLYDTYFDMSYVDTFTYTANDGKSNSKKVTVTINVLSVNDVPEAEADYITTNEDTPVLIDVLDNDIDIDGDTLTITNLSKPKYGFVELRDNKVLYDTYFDMSYVDTFTYTANDGKSNSKKVTVTINVLSVNDVPEAEADYITTNEDTPVLIDVLYNDIDFDGDTLTITNLSKPKYGFAIVKNGQVLYKPNNNFYGNDSFTYTANDGKSNSKKVTVVVTIKKLNSLQITDLNIGTATHGLHYKGTKEQQVAKTFSDIKSFFSNNIDRKQKNVILMQEVDINTIRSGRVDQLNAIKNKMGKDWYSKYAHTINYNDGKYGIGSLYNMHATSEAWTLKKYNPTDETRKTIVLKFRNIIDGHSLFVINVHFTHKNMENAYKQFEEVIHRVNINSKIKNEDVVMIVGDYNIKTTVNAYKKLITLAKRNSFTRIDNNTSTFPTKNPYRILDHALIRDKGRHIAKKYLKVVSSITKDKKIYTDHNALILNLKW